MVEIQDNLANYDENMKFENFSHLVKLKPNLNSLENEKKKFLDFVDTFIGNIDFEKKYCKGRPKFFLADIIKSLLVMSFNGMSFRRTESDLIELKSKGIIQHLPKRSTLNKYMQIKETKKLMEELIQISSLFFIESEDTIILDSTWLANRMYTGGYRKVYNKTSGSLHKVRKLHIACLKNSKIIAVAKASIGTRNDSPMFMELVAPIIKNGFAIHRLLADAGYLSKDNYAFCKEMNINNIFIDFKKNVGYKRAKSSAWTTQLKIYKQSPVLWHENYRFRVIVEGIFSAMKRKQLNYLRSRTENAQDVELLLKALVYNLTIIGKYY